MAESTEMVNVVGPDGPLRHLRSFRVRPASNIRDDHLHTLELAAGTFARRLTSELVALTRAEATVEMASIEQWSWADLLAANPEPACAAPLSAAPLSGAGMITCDLPLAMAIVDRLLGGPGTGPSPSRRLTEVETVLLQQVEQRIVEALTAALAIVVPIEPFVVRQESRLQLIKAAEARSLLIRFTAEVTLGAIEGEVSIALPAPDLFICLDAFGGGAGPSPVSGDMTGPVLDLAVTMRVRYNPASLTPGEIVDLAVGDVLPLPHPLNQPLTVWVGSQPYLSAIAGRRGNRLACAIVEPSTGASE